MTETLRILLLAALLLVTVGLIFVAQAQPGYFSNITYLGAILLFQIIAASIWHYEQTFFLLIVCSFLLGGMNTPFLGVGMTARWFVLAAGAFAGYIRWMKYPRKHFTAVHLAALFAVLAALVSAMVSAMPQMALLKVFSLFLLFLYGSSGARLAIAGREEQFIHGLLLGCEWTVYITLICYFVVHRQIFGNPNSLGAVIGVVVLPILLWGTLISETRYLRQRRAFALFLSCYLLYFALSRAAIAAAAASTVVLCICLRRQRLLAQGLFFLIFFLAVAGALDPTHFDDFTSAITSSVVYKGKREQGLLGSRRTPWQQTVAVIQEHPWFGSGFGTSQLQTDSSNVSTSWVYTREDTGREHGSSYLAIAEWVGLLGVVPFAVLIGFVLQKILRVCAWMRSTASPYHNAIPFAMVLIGGLVHAFLEDWLLAVGYYLTVVFWSFAFILTDLSPARDEGALGTVYFPPEPIRVPAIASCSR
jgi:O-antigen ligase